jgi:hypothetical protein
MINLWPLKDVLLLVILVIIYVLTTKNVLLKMGAILALKNAILLCALLNLVLLILKEKNVLLKFRLMLFVLIIIVMVAQLNGIYMVKEFVIISKIVLFVIVVALMELLMMLIHILGVICAIPANLVVLYIDALRIVYMVINLTIMGAQLANVILALLNHIANYIVLTDINMTQTLNADFVSVQILYAHYMIAWSQIVNLD